MSSFFLLSCTFVKEQFGISETTALENPEYKESEVYFKEKNYSIDSIEQPSTPLDLISDEQRSLFRLITVEYETVYLVEDEKLKAEIVENSLEALSTTDTEEEEKALYKSINAFALEKYVSDNAEHILTYLQSKGFYSAQVNAEIDYDVFPVRVTFAIEANNEYKIAQATISYPRIFKPYVKEHISSKVENVTDELEENELLAEQNLIENNEITVDNKDADEQKDGQNEPSLDTDKNIKSVIPQLPSSLFEFGLVEGKSANTQNILDAEKKLLPWFRNNGFPFAEIVFSRYFAFQDKEEFESIVRVNPKDFVLFGDIILEGSHELSLDYINIIKTWKKNDPWDESKVELLKNDLFSLGIFSQVSIVPVKTSYVSKKKKESREEREKRLLTEGDEYIVKITLKDAPPRSFGGGIAYNTSRGIGLKFFWEHRNLFSSAEQLSLNLDFWTDLQRASLNFRKPNIFINSLDFENDLIFEREVFDAYTTTSLINDIGFEQNFSTKYFENLTLSYYLQTVVGYEEDHHTNLREDYYYVGLPIRLTSRTTDSVLDPSSGYVFSVQASPYTGEFRDHFSVFQVEGSFATFFELLDNKKLVAAFRAKAGALFSEEVNNIPPPLRFYSGGANSVRGYSYQSLGPVNKYGEALGGASMFEASFELRYKFNEDMALVPFVDMGNVYDTYSIDFAEDFKFGTGIGFRYYTLAGPLRLDLAVPFDNTNGFAFKDFQVYISIGQSF